MKTGDKVVLKDCSEFRPQMRNAKFGIILEEIARLGWVRVLWDGGEDNTYPIVDLDLFEKSKQEEKMEVKVIQIQNVKINGVERNLTVCVVYDGKILRGGYSIKLPTDTENKKLAEKIAYGRAMNPKTNLIYMEVGKGMDRKFIFHAVAEDLVRQIERGVVTIKGVK